MNSIGVSVLNLTDGVALDYIPLSFNHDRQLSAISRQPWSTTSEWPRSANSTSSVFASEWRYCLSVAFVIGTDQRSSAVAAVGSALNSPGVQESGE